MLSLSLFFSRPVPLRPLSGAGRATRCVRHSAGIIELQVTSLAPSFECLGLDFEIWRRTNRTEAREWDEFSD